MLAHVLRQLLWREEVERLQRELADQEAVEKAARETVKERVCGDH